MQRKVLLAIPIVAMMGLGSLAVQAAPAVVAGTGYGTIQYSAPPAPLAESIPSPREGYVWAPGHYELRNGQYVWISGHWLRDRPGFVWEEARWQRDADGRWYLAGGRWVEDDDYTAQFDDRRWHSRRFGPNGDLDGDGILNRDDRDRDGDGVANWDDDFPNNPNRS